MAGEYVCLTSARLEGEEIFAFLIATHFVLLEVFNI